uniref:Uncharacterized protein n=1 Tax=Opuntia streptacantha TaxID=393608 RepID=A0A7C9AZG0_OPUST
MIQMAKHKSLYYELSVPRTIFVHQLNSNNLTVLETLFIYTCKSPFTKKALGAEVLGCSCKLIKGECAGRNIERSVRFLTDLNIVSHFLPVSHGKCRGSSDVRHGSLPGASGVRRRRSRSITW